MKRDNANIFHGRNLIASLITLLFLVLALTTCETRKQPPEPPVTIPFAVQHAGATIETKLLVQEHRPYLFDLVFGFEKKDPNDRERVKKLAGDYGRNQNGKLINPGISVPLNLNINVIDSLGERPIFNLKIVEEEMRGYGADHFLKQIATIPLKPGHYRVSVETMRDTPDLIGTFVFLKISFYAKSTPIKED